MKLIFLSFSWFFISFICFADDTIPVYNKYLSKQLTYSGDFCNNFSGGLKKSNLYLGIAHFKLAFNLNYFNCFKGGELFVNAAAAHGKSPSQFLTGDYQVVSNIDAAGDHIYIQELWYKHHFNRLDFSVGLLDMNKDFLVVDGGAEFINSSFGVPPVLSANIPVPIFPLTNFGFAAKVKLSDKLALQAALFDGCPKAWEHNKYNLNWHLSKDDGLFNINEIHYSSNFHSLAGTYKLGVYYHSGLVIKETETDKPVKVFDNNYGYYFLADQLVWNNKDNDKKVALFLQFVISDKNINKHHIYSGAGINFYGIFDEKNSDVAGFAFARADFNNSFNNYETAIELFYNKQLNENISIKPDLQYIINPSGTETNLKNSLLGIIRINLSF